MGAGPGDGTGRRLGTAPTPRCGHGTEEGRVPRMSFLLGVAIFVVALLGSIMLHEAGHFATTKMFGMKATQFFVGFGRTVWSHQKDETEYNVKAIPAGGFVKIIEMTDLEDVNPADEPRSFRKRPASQRIIVLTAGSFIHFVLALVLL